jgi:hypothetical protein
MSPKRKTQTGGPVPPPSAPLTFHDLPQDVRRTILFEAAADHRDREQNSENRVFRKKLAHLSAVSAILCHDLEFLLLGVTPSTRLSCPLPPPLQVCKRFRDDFLGPGAAGMWANRGFNVGLSLRTESAEQVTAVVLSLSLFLGRHAPVIRTGFIGKNIHMTAQYIQYSNFDLKVHSYYLML